MISDICEKYGITKYSINEDSSIDVNENVDLYSMGLTELPLKFNIVYGSFNCSYNHLTTLKGCPKIITDDFNCSRNNINSLEHGPKVVISDYYMMLNKLTSMDYLPESVGNYLYLDGDVDLPNGVDFSVKEFNEYDTYKLVYDYDKWYGSYHKNNQRKTTINNILDRQN
jgi:hypothetical protein